MGNKQNNLYGDKYSGESKAGIKDWEHCKCSIIFKNILNYVVFSVGIPRSSYRNENICASDLSGISSEEVLVGE